jgi:hypothetical protein
MDSAKLHGLKARLRPMLMEWVSEQVNSGEDYRIAAMMAAGALTAESLTIAVSLDATEQYVNMVAPLFAETAPESCTVLNLGKWSVQ